MDPTVIPPISIVRGNNRPIAWRLVGIDGTGSVWALSVRGPGVRFEKLSSVDGSGVVAEVDLEGDSDTTTITWTPTVLETRRFPLGRSLSYELERRVPGEGGEQRTYLAGTFVPTSGIASD